MANPNKDSVDLAKDEALRQRKGGQAKQMVLWFAALIVGAILGWLQVPALNELFNFVATVFTRLFQFIAVPTIALAVITTLSALGAKKDTGRIFAHAVTYTLLTTIAAASIGLILYLWIAPGNLPADLIGAVPRMSRCRSSAPSPTTTTSSPSSRTTCCSRSSPATSCPSC